MFISCLSLGGMPQWYIGISLDGSPQTLPSLIQAGKLYVTCMYGLCAPVLINVYERVYGKAKTNGLLALNGKKQY